MEYDFDFWVPFIWTIAVVLVTVFGSTRTLGWRWTLVCSVLLTPILTLFILLLFTDKSSLQKELFKTDIIRMQGIVTSKKIRSKTIFKLAISLILFGCLRENMPSGYYTFVRISVFVLGTILAIIYGVNKQGVYSIFPLLLALLFNPFVEIAFEREMWQNIDKWAGIAFLMWAVLDFFSLREILSNKHEQS